MKFPSVGSHSQDWLVHTVPCSYLSETVGYSWTNPYPSWLIGCLFACLDQQSFFSSSFELNRFPILRQRGAHPKTILSLLISQIWFGFSFRKKSPPPALEVHFDAVKLELGKASLSFYNRRDLDALSFGCAKSVVICKWKRLPSSTSKGIHFDSETVFMAMTI